MGKAIRWLKALFGFKKEKNLKQESNSGDRKNKNPSCIRRSGRNPTNSPVKSPLQTPLYNNVNHHSDEQNKRAIQVATATAAAADAAVAAAQAAVAFVRLTSQNRLTTAREHAAAIKIQAFFRGFLSRKALKALKSLVKLQAVVRGYLVRKEAAATLQGMEALLRAQSSVCAQRFRRQDDKFHPRRSIKRANEARSKRISASLQIPSDGRLSCVEVGPEEPKSRLTRANTWAWTPDSGTQTPYHLAIPNHHEFEPRFSTTQNTPRFAYSCGPYGFYEGVSKDDSFASHPGYMANTKSFRAKVRSHSAPKQRPDFGFGVVKKRVEVECGPRMEKSKSPSLLEVNNFKNFVMSRIGKSSYV
ncbi:protein IQ-DOMAIN 14-like [Cynara cardunculus var. scolymus]|uniref:protein IQ-DOMAIN 14-like n=1 Tax=Cynara cardunculus var. scolymus TaxID=59895 RepID=UPI000D623AB6|nr:protein IQ-DOMAIN 14-like [Cynara cardunculus var. scolymus]